MRIRGDIISFAILSVTAVLSSSASAQTQQQLNWCNGKDGATPDLAIKGCTAVIRSRNQSKKNLAVAYYRRGRAYHNKSQYDRAIEDYNQTIKLNPKSARAFSNRGLAYARKSQHDRAIKDFDQAIRLSPKEASAFSNRGDVYGKKGQLDLAIEDYSQAIKLSPRFANAFNNRGFAYLSKGQYDLAIRDLDQAIRLNPRLALAFYNRGAAYVHKGQNDRAAADYRTALKLDPHLTVAKDALKRVNANLSAAKNAPIAGGAATKEAVPRKDSFAAEVLKKLEETQEYKTLIAYFASKNGGDPAWASSAQGRAVLTYLAALRLDAIATRVVDSAEGKYLVTTIDGVTTSDKKVAVAALKSDADCRQFTANAIALRIVASAKLQAFLATLKKSARPKH